MSVPQISFVALHEMQSITAPAASETGKQLQRKLQELRPAPYATPGSALQDSLEEHLFNKLSALKIYTSKVAMHLDAIWREKLFKQLDLMLSIDEWDLDDVLPSEDAFATFLAALISLRVERRPGLGLTSAGDVVGSWTIGEDRFTLVAKPERKVRWIVGRRLPDGVSERAAGDTTLSRLVDVIAPYDVRRWLGGEGT